MSIKVCLVEEIANVGYYIAKGLSNYDFTIKVILDRKRYLNRLLFAQKPLPDVQISWINTPLTHFRALGLLRPFYKEILQFKPDIITVNYLWTQSFISVLAAKKLHVPILGIGHGWDVLVVPDSYVRGKLQRVFVTRMDKILMTADYYIDKFSKVVPREKMVYIGRAIDTDFFRPGLKCDHIRSKYGDHIVTFIARLNKIKSPYTVLKAFRYVVNEVPTANLLIMGKGPEEEGMKKFTRKLGIDKNVFFLGEVKNVEIPFYLNASRVEVRGFQPNIVELGISQLEALSCGTPVITYYPKNDVPGVIHSSPNPREIAEKIIMVLQDPQLRNELSEQARSYAIKNFSLDSFIRRIISIYKDVASNRI